MPQHECEVLKDSRRSWQIMQFRYRGLNVVWHRCQRDLAIFPECIARFWLSMLRFGRHCRASRPAWLHLTPERVVVCPTSSTSAVEPGSSVSHNGEFARRYSYSGSEGTA